MSKESRLVYSTESGRVRRDSNVQASFNPPNSVCHVRLETKGRGGKDVTVVWNIPGGQTELKSLVKAIKQKLGTGGSVKNGQLVIQGDHVKTIFAFLKSKGFEIKKAGG